MTRPVELLDILALMCHNLVLLFQVQRHVVITAVKPPPPKKHVLNFLVGNCKLSLKKLFCSGFLECFSRKTKQKKTKTQTLLVNNHPEFSICLFCPLSFPVWFIFNQSQRPSDTHNTKGTLRLKLGIMTLLQLISLQPLQSLWGWHKTDLATKYSTSSRS